MHFFGSDQQCERTCVYSPAALYCRVSAVVRWFWYLLILTGPSVPLSLVLGVVGGASMLWSSTALLHHTFAVRFNG